MSGKCFVLASKGGVIESYTSPTSTLECTETEFEFFRNIDNTHHFPGNEAPH